MKTAVKFLIALVLSLLLAWAVRTYVFTIFSVPQGGLPPQLKAGNRVIVNRIDCENFGRGDVVVFTDTVVYQPKNQRRKRVFESHFIGRIEKLPGDTLVHPYHVRAHTSRLPCHESPRFPPIGFR